MVRSIYAIGPRLDLPIGGYDTLVACHARSRGAVVVTGNPREFDRVEGLPAEDWLPSG